MDRLEKQKQFLKDIGISDQGYQDEGMFDHIADVLAKYDEHQAKHNEVLGDVSCWLPIEGNASNYIDCALNNGLVKFKDGEVMRHKDDWGENVPTYYYSTTYS